MCDTAGEVALTCLRRVVAMMTVYRNQLFDAQPGRLTALVESALEGKNVVKVLEIGSWCGCSSVILGNITKKHNGILVCVDWWKGSKNDSPLWIIARLHDVYSIFWRRICKVGLSDCVIPMRGDSKTILPMLQNGLFDLIFIDASHEYVDVKADIRQAKRLIKKGGIIIGHDFEDERLITANLRPYMHHGVIRAVKEDFENYELDHGFWMVRI